MKKQLMLLMDDHSEQEAQVPGKDEMNFAEFPITLLTDKVPKGQKSIKFEDEIYDEKRKKVIPRRRIIEGSDEYGLPTATDDTVVLALIQLTKQKNNFTQREVEFTRLELIRLLGWADAGASFERIKKSLLRIKLVNYIYDNAWWDTRQKMWTTKAFNIIDNVEINDSRTGQTQGGLFPSRIVWNEVVFDSFQAGFLRNIDFQLCMRLEHPIALRMYRFLGKRFYVRPECVFDLSEFASVHLALGGNYEGGTQIARKLKPAIAELESVGFLEPLSEKERFNKKGRDWTVRFVQKVPPGSPVTLPTPGKGDAVQPGFEQSNLETELTNREVTPRTASDLVKRHPAQTIQLKIEIFDWMVANKDKRIEKSPAGYLVKSITDDFSVPKEFVSAAERKRQEEARQAKERQEAEAHRIKQEADRQERQLAEQVKAFRLSQTPEQLAQLETAAIADASGEIRRSLDDSTMKPFRKTQISMLVNEHIARLIQAKEQTSELT